MGTPRWCCPITCETKVASMAYDQLVDIKDLIAEIEDHLTEDNFADVAGRVNTLKPARDSKIFERLGHRRRAIVYRLLDKDLALEVFEGLSPVLQSELVDALQERDTVDVFANMAPDGRVWVVDVLCGRAASLGTCCAAAGAGTWVAGRDGGAVGLPGGSHWPSAEPGVYHAAALAHGARGHGTRARAPGGSGNHLLFAGN